VNWLTVVLRMIRTSFGSTCSCTSGPTWVIAASIWAKVVNDVPGRRMTSVAFQL
jgi:hypothetical protein